MMTHSYAMPPMSYQLVDETSREVLVGFVINLPSFLLLFIKSFFCSCFLDHFRCSCLRLLEYLDPDSSQTTLLFFSEVLFRIFFLFIKEIYRDILLFSRFMYSYKPSSILYQGEDAPSCLQAMQRPPQSFGRMRGQTPETRHICT